MMKNAALASKQKSSAPAQTAMAAMRTGLNSIGATNVFVVVSGIDDDDEVFTLLIDE